MRKDTTDESDNNNSLFVIQTREQKFQKNTQKRRIITTDFNELASKCLKSNIEKEKASSSNDLTSESVDEISEYVQQSEITHNFKDTGHDVYEQEEQHNFYKQFLNDEYANNQNALKRNMQNELVSEKPSVSPTANPPDEEVVYQDFKIPHTSSGSNVITYSPTDQVLAVSCSGCVENSKQLSSFYQTLVAHGTMLNEMKALLVASTVNMNVVLQALANIKQDTSATLLNFSPDENKLASIVPEFEVPINTVELLERFEEKLKRDDYFKSIVVRPIFVFQLKS